MSDERFRAQIRADYRRWRYGNPRPVRTRLGMCLQALCDGDATTPVDEEAAA